MDEVSDASEPGPPHHSRSERPHAYRHLSGQPLALDKTSLQRDIDSQRRAAGVPGVALAIVQGEEVVFAAGFGVTSAEEGRPVTPGTLFRIASVTKPLTGTAILRLVDFGRLDLHAPIREYVPWLRFQDEGVAERITLRLLLSHRAGLPFTYQTCGSRDPGGLEAYVREEIPRLALAAEPGTVWRYSNAGIDLAGFIVEVVHGKPSLRGEAPRDSSRVPLGWGRGIQQPFCPCAGCSGERHSAPQPPGVRV